MKCVTAATSRQCHTLSTPAPDQTRWWSTMSIHCRQGCCRLANVIWYLEACKNNSYWQLLEQKHSSIYPFFQGNESMTSMSANFTPHPEWRPQFMSHVLLQTNWGKVIKISWGFYNPQVINKVELSRHFKKHKWPVDWKLLAVCWSCW